MKVFDKNRTLEPPDDGGAPYTFTSVTAEGAYLVLRFVRYFPDLPHVAEGMDEVLIYLNDQGREVLRTEYSVKYDIKPPVVLEPAKTFWQQVWHDIQEIFFCA